MSGDRRKSTKRAEIVWRFAGEPISKKRLASIEARLKVRFPTDYVECALTYHGGYPDHECFDFPGRKEAVFSRLLNFTEDEDNKYTIVTYYEAIKDRLPEKVIPFAEDPFGNFLCFDYRRDIDNPSVVFWDHEKAVSKKSRSTSFVCDSFTALVQSLYKFKD